MDKSFGEHGLMYCVTNEIDYDEDIITGCLSEEHLPNIDSVDEEKNTFTPDVTPSIATLFAIDLKEKRMIVQHREYPANNLNKQQSMTRLNTLINSVFHDLYHTQFDYVDTYRAVTDDDLLVMFRQHRVTLLRVQLLDTGRYLQDHAEIFPQDDINRHWIEGWNTDESNMYEIVLKAPGRGGNGDLRKSPIAVSLLNMTQRRIVELNYWTGRGNQRMSRNDFKKFRIHGIDRNTQVITSISHISREVYRRRTELSTFRLVHEVQ